MRALAAVLAVSLTVAACDSTNAPEHPPADIRKTIGIPRRRAPSPPSSESTASSAAPPAGHVECPPSPQSHVVGRILDEAGNVPPGAVIRLPRWMSSRRCGYGGISASTPADAAGFVDWTDPGIPWDSAANGRRLVRLVAEAKGCVPWVGPWIEAGGDLVDFGTLRLRRGEAIAGVLCDVAGDPLSDVEVDLTLDQETVSEDWLAANPAKWSRTRHESVAGVASAQTAKDGTFSFDGLAPGRYRLRCARRGAPPAFVVASGTTDARIVLPPALCPRRVAIDVIAFDAARTRVERFSATLAGEDERRSATAENAVASVELTTWGPVTLLVDRAGEDQRVEVEEVETRREPYVANFPQCQEIRGTVLLEGQPVCWSDGARNGTRALPVWVIAMPEPSGGDSWLRGAPPTVASDSDGTFALLVPHSGRWTLQIRDHAETAPVAGIVTAESGATDVTIEVHRVADLEVQVLPIEGERVEDVRGWMTDASSSVQPCFRVDRDRNCLRCYDATVGAPLVLHVRGICGGERTQVSTLDVRADAGPYEVRLARGLSIDGVVLRQDGTPVVAAEVRCDSASEPDEDAGGRTTSGLAGRFRLTGLAPGSWSLTAGTDALECSCPVEAVAGSCEVRIVVLPRKSPF